ncbi:MAG: mechanosensitive ion channel [Chitinophagaceae bacterium]|nr:mechanosensitive ion channel [Chitinophagaceae bacterium]
MNNFLDSIFLDNSIQDYLVVGLVILGIYILKKFFSKPLVAAIILFLKLAGRQIDKKAFNDLILKPLEQFLIVFTAFIALISLKFPRVFMLSFYRTDTQTILERMGLSLVIIYFFRLLIRMIDYLAYVISKKAGEESGQEENQLVIFFKDFLKAVVFIAGFFTVIKFAFRYQISELLTGLGIVGAALALSARESLENLIASFIIFFDKPFAVGDTLKIQNITGTVEKIGLRSTRIRTNEKTYVSVPNKQMVDSIVDNLSLRTQRRADLKLELKSTTNAQSLQALLDGIKKILQHPKIENRVLFLGDIVQQGGYLVHIEYYTAPIPAEEFNQVKQEVNLAIIQLMENLDIEVIGARQGE